LKKLSEDLD